jgi:hypothetical protein
VAIWAIDDVGFFHTNHPAFLFYLSQSWVFAVVGAIDDRANRQLRSPVFPGILRLAKKQGEGIVAQLNECPCMFMGIDTVTVFQWACAAYA